MQPYVRVPSQCSQKERRKKLEPFEVPKSGHFYLHDDRRAAADNEDEEEEEPRDARPERKKLWAGDQGKWQHDKFVDDLPVCAPFHTHARTRAITD